jgi:dihydroneopterin aldolase
MGFERNFDGDCIRLEGMKFRLIIGILPQERREAQPVEVDLKLWGPFSRAAESGHLGDTADYSLVYRELGEWISSTGFELLETLAARCAGFLFDRFPAVQALELSLTKPQALPDGVRASYTIRRSREEKQ